MDHKVQNVTQLYDDSTTLEKDGCTSGSDTSADGIINNLNLGIGNLKSCWEGKDAGKQIQNIVEVYNAMVNIRNVLAKLAADASGIASNYREIQNANGAGLESFEPLTADEKTTIPDYSDDRDTISITPEANTGKEKIDLANQSIDEFISTVQTCYDNIMNNWQTGTGREQAQSAFEDFIANSQSYKTKLQEASESISNAIKNYSF